jgi:trehalose-phosphatase
MGPKIMQGHLKQTIVKDLLAAYRAGRRLILLFDYDGTLVPIADHPRLARLTSDGRRLLERLAGQPRVHVGIISGRTLAELKDILCLPSLCLAGTSGLELDLDGLQLAARNVRRAHALVQEAAHRVSARLADFAGAWLENKGSAFTVHYRHALPQSIGNLRAQVQEILRPFSSALRTNEGPMALEVIPELGWNKGTAVAMIVRHLRASNYLLLYAGDSANDVEAMETATALGGIAVGIGPDAPSAAQLHLQGPRDLHEMLVDLVRGLYDAEEPAQVSMLCRQGTA